MQYRVVVPFGTGEGKLKRNAVVGEWIEERKNFLSLLNDGYLEKLADTKTGLEFIEGCYIVVVGFKGKGSRYAPGDFVDLRDKAWRNEQALLDSGYLRRATIEEVARHTAHSPLDTTPGSGNIAEGRGQENALWRDEDWLREKYLDEGKTMIELQEEAGCSLSTLSKWMHRFNIPMKPRGRPTE